jgi:preprotein translocase subunit SecY
MAILGLAVLVVSFLLLVFLNESALQYGIFAGISVVVASGIARKIERKLIHRQTFGVVMVLIPIIYLFIWQYVLIPLAVAPALIIAVYLLVSRRQGVVSSVIFLFVVIAYAAIWPVGGRFFDASWGVDLSLMWS